MAIHRFPSLGAPTWRYAVSDDHMQWWDANWRSGGLAPGVTRFDTLGDGDCQHTPNYPVQIADLGDFCLSALDALPACHGLAGALRVDVASGSDLRSRVVFLWGVKVSQSKSTYWSPSELRSSTSPSKSHDKRWFRLDTDFCAEDPVSLRRALHQARNAGQAWGLGAMAEWLGIEETLMLLSAGQRQGWYFRDQESVTGVPRPAYEAFRALAGVIRAEDSRTYGERLIADLLREKTSKADLLREKTSKIE